MTSYSTWTSIWTFVVIVPFVYLCMLPSLTQLYLDGKPFAHYQSDSLSISAYLQTPPANGGFALFITPSVVYLTSNPITRTSNVASVGSVFLVIGYVLIVLFPLGYASAGQHSVGFVTASFGLALVSLGLVLSIKFSPILIGIFVVLLLINIVTSLVYFVPSTLFVVLEYVNALFALGFAPLVNTLGRSGRWIWFERRWRLCYDLSG